MNYLETWHPSIVVGHHAVAAVIGKINRLNQYDSIFLNSGLACSVRTGLALRLDWLVLLGITL